MKNTLSLSKAQAKATRQNKAKPAFDMLEKEFQILSTIEQAAIKGGGGVVTSGAGSLMNDFTVQQNQPPTVSSGYSTGITYSVVAQNVSLNDAQNMVILIVPPIGGSTGYAQGDGIKNPFL